LNNPSGDCVEELGMVAPAPHQRRIEPPCGRVEQLLLVAPTTSPVVRASTIPHHPPVSVRHDLLDHVVDSAVRLPKSTLDRTLRAL